MLALAFHFLAGRYHATPWDRHVNEGAVAWPPEPWRILRSLIATWHHKVKHDGIHDEATLRSLLERLSEALPEYALPRASHSHTRHYMPQFERGKTTLVLDAFAAVQATDPLTVIWPEVQLTEAQTSLLDALLSVMGYLGRAESWVEARRVDEVPPANCRPGTDAIDAETGEIVGEPVMLSAPLPPADYANLRGRFLVDAGAARRLRSTLPEDWLAALSAGTADLRKIGWSQPPAARWVSYLRPVQALRPVHSAKQAARLAGTTVQFVLSGKPLPRVEDSVRIGELFRQALMSRAKHHYGEDGLPAIFSGHGLPADNRHTHAFFLPWDMDGDGRIERLVLHVPQGMDELQQQISEEVARLWSRDGLEWRLHLEGAGASTVSPLLQTSTQWRSVTPYLHPWYCKKGFGVEQQLRRECLLRGLPEPELVERLESVPVGSRLYRPAQFRRSRSRRGSPQPDSSGSFWRLTFSEPVAGPMAFGSGCHFGLGLFAPPAAHRTER